MITQEEVDALREIMNEAEDRVLDLEDDIIYAVSDAEDAYDDYMDAKKEFDEQEDESE